MNPSKIIYDVGLTQFGQRLTLEHTAKGYGDGWKLIQHASSQRDEDAVIHVTEFIATAILDKLR